mgnify:CR=1 FL=1
MISNLLEWERVNPALPSISCIWASGSSKARANASTVGLDGYRIYQSEFWKRASGQCLPSCNTGHPSCRFRQSSAAAFLKNSHQSAPVPPPEIDCCKIYRLLRTAAGQDATSKQDSSDNASSRRLCSTRLSVCSSTYRSSMYAAISTNSFPLI